MSPARHRSCGRDPMGGRGASAEKRRPLEGGGGARATRRRGFGGAERELGDPNAGVTTGAASTLGTRWRLRPVSLADEDMVGRGSAVLGSASVGGPGAYVCGDGRPAMVGRWPRPAPLAVTDCRVSAMGPKRMLSPGFASVADLAGGVSGRWGWPCFSSSMRSGLRAIRLSTASNGSRSAASLWIPLR